MQAHDSRRFGRLATCLLAAATVVATGCHDEEAAVTPTGGPMLDAANGASKKLAAYFEANSQTLESVLVDIEKAGDQKAELPAKLAAARAKLPDHAVLTVFDAKRQLVVGDVQPEGLPPYKVVMPLLRHIEKDKQPLVTEMWLGADKQYWIAQGRIRGTGEKALTAVAAYRVADKGTSALLGSLAGAGIESLKILDNKGVAVWSTQADERFKSAVHGTYLTDKIQSGKPIETKCHSCHEGADHHIVRSDVRITVVPVAGSKWSIVVR